MILVVDMNREKDSLESEEFAYPIVSICNKMKKCDLIHYIDVDAGVVKNYDRVILSGTPLGETGYIKEIERFDWIKSLEKPLIGICAGMQVIGLLFGSELKECQEIGMTYIDVVKENPLFPSNIMVYELHKYAIKPSGRFEVLAKSEKCVQAIRHKDKELYGLLFHPEVRNRDILKRFIMM